MEKNCQGWVRQQWCEKSFPQLVVATFVIAARWSRFNIHAKPASRRSELTILLLAVRSPFASHDDIFSSGRYPTVTAQETRAHLPRRRLRFSVLRSRLGASLSSLPPGTQVCWYRLCGTSSIAPPAQVCWYRLRGTSPISPLRRSCFDARRSAQAYGEWRCSSRRSCRGYSFIT
jgi:hypothetical protein